MYLQYIYLFFNHRQLYDADLVTVVWMYINFADQKKSYWRTIVYWTSNCEFCIRGKGIDSSD